MYDTFLNTDEAPDDVPVTGEAGSLASKLASGTSVTPYPFTAMFGVLPTHHPSEHPAATGSASGIISSGPSDTAPVVEPDEIDSAFEPAEAEQDYRDLTGRYNPIWSLELTDLGLSKGDRGKNPLGHFGESENYFVVHDDNLATDHKRIAVYNFQHFALCDMKESDRDPSESAGGQELDDKEYYLLWKYCRDNGLVTEYTPIPLQGLAWYAVEHDFCDPDDLEQFQTGDDDGDKKAKRNLKLPDEAYIPVLKDIEEKTGPHTGPTRWEQIWHR